MKNSLLILGTTILLMLWLRYAKAETASDKSRPAPEFPTHDASRWINSPPLKMTDTGENGLRGKVILLNVWTFMCWNCSNSYPWIREVQSKFKNKDFVIIGIHSPEFDREREVKNVQAAVDKNKLAYPHYIDNDFAYWRALQNQYWPAFYLIDKKGQIRLVEVGEMHSGKARAKNFEGRIEALLAE